MKRIISYILAIVILLTMMPPVFAADIVASGTCGDEGDNLVWTLNTEGTLTISGIGTMQDDNLPWEVSGYNDDIKKIVIEEGVTSIGRSAFSQCFYLEMIELPESLTFIGLCAFSYCQSLKTIFIPANVRYFSVCAFPNCFSLESILVDEQNKRFYSQDGVLYSTRSDSGDRSYAELLTYPAGKNDASYTIPDNIRSIANNACNGAMFAELHIPESVTYIDHQAFEACKNLSSVYVPDSVTVLGSRAFAYCNNLISARLPDTIKLHGSTFTGCTNLTTVNLPSTLSELPPNTFALCTSLKEITIPDSVTNIGLRAFEQCHSLESLELPEGLTGIGEYAFWGCSKITTFNIPESVTEIGAAAFAYCANAEEIILPSKLTRIERLLFVGCLSLQSILIPECVTSIGDSAFNGCHSLQLIRIPASVLKLGTRPFSYSDNLKAIYFYGDAPSFSEYAFQDFSGTLFYPKSNAAWTDDVMQDYMGDVIWTPFDSAYPFLDVPTSVFYTDSVLWAMDNKITSGTSDTTFSPGNDCLRAQVVTFLWRAAGEPNPTITHNPFVDVKESDFYYKAVLWAVEKGITTGADATHFNPNGVCNRAQVVTFLYRTFGNPAVDAAENPFTDVPGDTWYTAPVLWAVENGITNGLSATEFGPNSNCNRAQIVTFLYRAYN